LFFHPVGRNGGWHNGPAGFSDADLDV